MGLFPSLPFVVLAAGRMRGRRRGPACCAHDVFRIWRQRFTFFTLRIERMRTGIPSGVMQWGWQLLQFVLSNRPVHAQCEEDGGGDLTDHECGRRCGGHEYLPSGASVRNCTDGAGLLPAQESDMWLKFF